MTVSGETDLITLPPIDISTMPPVTVASGTFVPSGLRTKGLITLVDIDNTQWWPVPPTPLVARNSISIQNLSGQAILMEFDNTKPLSEGWTIFNNGVEGTDVTDNIIIYAIATTAAPCTIVAKELS